MTTSSPRGRPPTPATPASWPPGPTTRCAATRVGTCLGQRAAAPDSAHAARFRSACAGPAAGLLAGLAFAAARVRGGKVVSDPVASRTARQRLLADLAPVQ